MNRSTNLIFILILLTGFLYGQNEKPVIGNDRINISNDPHFVLGKDATPHNHSQCITDSQRAEVKSRIQKNITKYKIKLENKKSIITLFDWPIEQNSSFDYNSTIALWQYVDHDPAFPDQLEDYNCGDNTYDTPGGYNHRGIDIGLWPFMQHQVNDEQTHIIAAAAGTIVDKNDGEPHLNCSNPDVPANYVIVQHADGSETWYWHMKNGSVTTKSIGSSVTLGEYLGVVASSGNSSGPHLHFECYDTNNNLIDPYAGPCNNMNSSSYWNNQKPYWEPTINVLLTHDALPNFGNCPNLETKNEQNNFNGGDIVYFASYLHDQLSTSSFSYKIIQPNGVVWQNWTNSSPSDYRTSYWIWNYVLPTSAMAGTWKWEGTLNGQTVSHDFYVAGPVEPNLTCSNLGNLSITNTLNVSGVQVINDGNASAASSTLGYYLSTNTNFTTSDYLAGTDFVGALAINQTSTENTTISSSNILNMPPDGNYYLGMIVDYLGVVSESDETDNNNCFYLSPQVIVGCTNSSAHNYSPSANFDNDACMTCNDGIQNGDESAVDCGGALCSPCANCNVSINAFPSISEFQGNIGNWIQSSSDDLDWTIISGPTPSSGTGTSNTYSMSDYIYIEASGNFNSTAVLNFSCFDLSSLSSPELSFAYNMEGTGMGSLVILVSDDYGTTWTVKFNKSGDQGVGWHKEVIDLSEFSGETIQISIEGTTGATYQSDIGIDQFIIKDKCTSSCTNTISTYNYNNFFEANIGDFEQIVGCDHINWSHNTGSTSSSNTGPTSGYVNSNGYMYIESSAPNNPFKMAVIESPCFNTSSLNLPAIFMTYHMYGAEMGFLELEISDDNGQSWEQLFTSNGDQTNNWNSYFNEGLNIYNNTVKFRITGITGNGYTSDMAFDYFWIYERCPDSYLFSAAQNVSSIYEADMFIQSSSVISAPYMEYDAGQFIELLSGFEVQSGTEFKAFIDGCGDNGNELFNPDDDSFNLKRKNIPLQNFNR